MKVEMLLATRANLGSAVAEMEQTYGRFLADHPGITILGESMQFLREAGQVYGVMCVRYQ